MVEALLITGVVVCLLAEAFFSGSETAIISADKAKLRAAALDGDPRARLAVRMIEQTERVIGTTLVGTNFAVSAGSILATLVVGLHMQEKQWQSLATTLIMTPLILIVGEILPKSICRASAYAITLHVVRPLRAAQRLMLPVVLFVNHVANLLLRLTGGKKSNGQPSLSREELVVLAELGQEQGTIAPQERRMIKSLLELNERPLSTAMAPLVHVVGIDINATPDDVKATAARTGYARFPVYSGRIDNIVGVVALVDILSAEASSHGEPSPPQATLEPFVQRDVTFVPETIPIATLLRDLQQSATPMVIAVDEHGGVAGLATREDIVEEIVGDIHDERDRAAPRLAVHGEDTFECDGKLEVDELNERLGLAIEKEGFETVAGLVMKLAGKIPQAQEAFDYGNLRVEILEADARRVRRVRFVKTHETA